MKWWFWYTYGITQPPGNYDDSEQRGLRFPSRFGSLNIYVYTPNILLKISLSSLFDYFSRAIIFGYPRHVNRWISPPPATDIWTPWPLETHNLILENLIAHRREHITSPDSSPTPTRIGSPLLKWPHHHQHQPPPPQPKPQHFQFIQIRCNPPCPPH